MLSSPIVAADGSFADTVGETLLNTLRALKFGRSPAEAD